MKSNQIKQASSPSRPIAILQIASLILLRVSRFIERATRSLYVAVIGCLAGVLATGGVATPLSIPDILPSAWGNHGNGGIPLPGQTAAHRGLSIPTPESLVMASRPKAWKAQSRRSICPSRVTAIRLIS